jgi:hypothetical protein
MNGMEMMEVEEMDMEETNAGAMDSSEPQSPVAPRIEINADGSQSIIGPNGESTVIMPVDDVVVSGAHSAARQRLEKLKSQRGPVIEPFEHEGEVFYIRRLNYQQLIDVALAVSRDGHNVLNIHEETGVRSVTIAVLATSVCCEDGAPYFTHEDVEAYIDSADDAALVSALFSRCNEANPDIFSTLKNA